MKRKIINLQLKFLILFLFIVTTIILSGCNILQWSKNGKANIIIKNMTESNVNNLEIKFRDHVISDKIAEIKSGDEIVLNVDFAELTGEGEIIMVYQIGENSFSQVIEGYADAPSLLKKEYTVKINSDGSCEIIK